MRCNLAAGSQSCVATYSSLHVGHALHLHGRQLYTPAHSLSEEGTYWLRHPVSQTVSVCIHAVPNFPTAQSLMLHPPRVSETKQCERLHHALPALPPHLLVSEGVPKRHHTAVCQVHLEDRGCRLAGADPRQLLCRWLACDTHVHKLPTCKAEIRAVVCAH
jgi:hypothetical protein